MQFNQSEPFGLPRGTVRAIITLLIIIGSLVFMIIRGEIPAGLVSILSVVATFYFVSREKQSATEVEEPLPKDTDIDINI